MSLKGLTYYIETFGCQMNQRDSQTIAGLLDSLGMVEEDSQAADVVIFNTCSVRQTAENKVWSRLGKVAASRKKDLPVMVLSGCMAQLPENVNRVRQRLPGVKIITGPGQIHKIPQLLEEVMGKKVKGPLVAVSGARTSSVREDATQTLPEELPRKNTPGVSAFVTIMYGCDHFCTYCIVPFVRGPQVSREPRYITGEVEDLVNRGYKEVTLLGQNVNDYGNDLEDPLGFSRLLQRLNEIPGLSRIRYYTSHPRDFTKEMVDVVKDCNKVCEHFHLPLQAGSDRILKLMNRGYTREQYLELVEYIHDSFHNASITTDIMVGFPGETREDFEDTLDMVRRCRFDGSYTFIFSPRTGTGASRMKNQISKQEKSERLQELVKVQNHIVREDNAQLIGRTFEILAESPDPDETGFWRGRTRTAKPVIAKARPEKEIAPGQLVNVKIEEAGTWFLRGTVED